MLITSSHFPLVTPHTLESSPCRSLNVGLDAVDCAVGRAGAGAGVGVGAGEDDNGGTNLVVPVALSDNEPLLQSKCIVLCTHILF